MDPVPPQINTPPPQREPLPKFVWVVVALSPSAIIMIGYAAPLFRGIDPRWMTSVLLTIDVVVGIIGSIGILRKPRENKVILGIGAIFLGCVFAVLNAGIGFFGACALGAMR